MSGPSLQPMSPMLARRAGLACLALLVLGLAAPSRADAPVKKVPGGPVGLPTVSLVIDYGNGKQKSVESLEWRSGMTAWDATRAAAQRPPESPLTFTGKGATVFVTGIGGLGNQGLGSDKRNWQLWVNGAFAQVGVGALELKAGDQVVWKFALPPPPGAG